MSGPGPESVAIDPDGRLYTGLQDGRVVRMRADGTGVETFAHTGGRPLGMKFDAGGNLIVADAFRGLLSVSPEGRVTVLADGVNGERMLFPNDIAIAADGVVWFSDASRRFDQHHWMLDFLEGRATGRLLRHDPRTDRVDVVLDRLMFANGVALGPGDEYVLVNETLAARIARYWLKGPRAGQSDIFASALPGYPDNSRRMALVAQSGAADAGAVARAETRTHGLGSRLQHGRAGGARSAGSLGKLRAGDQHNGDEWPAVFWQYRYGGHRMGTGAVDLEGR
jgi:sugar lactone lactonase YvrE